MRRTSSARPTRRSRTLRALTVTASAGLLLAALPAGVAAAGGHRTWVVHPGESIQAAVDRAASGDTISIEAGTYPEGVCVDGKGLTVVGAGRDRTRIVWPAWRTAADLPDVPATACWRAEDRADARSDHRTLADDVSGLFFLHPDSPVEVRGLSTWNHPADGIAAEGADGFRVSKTKGSGHGRFGILAADSRHSRITRNIEVGTDRGTPDAPAGGTAGIAVADSAQAYGAVVANDVQGYDVGVLAQEARSGSVADNYLSGNCVGLMVLDDAATSVPDASRDVAAGDWQVEGNDVRANDRFCLGGIGRAGGPLDVGEPLRASGTGVALVDADHVDVHGNLIRDNVPSVDPDTLDLPAAGLALISLPSVARGDQGPVEDVQVRGNSFGRNVPINVQQVSLRVNPHVRDQGTGIRISGNTSEPAVPQEDCGC